MIWIWLLHGFVCLSYVVICWIAATVRWDSNYYDSTVNPVHFVGYLLFGWLICPIFLLHKFYVFAGKKIKKWWKKINED